VLGVIFSILGDLIRSRCSGTAKAVKHPNAPAAGVAAANKKLWLGPATRRPHIAKTPALGCPCAARPIQPNEYMLIQRDYVIDYDDDLRDRFWTAHLSPSPPSDPKKTGRANCFRAMFRLPSVVAFQALATIPSRCSIRGI